MSWNGVPETGQQSQLMDLQVFNLQTLLPYWGDPPCLNTPTKQTVLEQPAANCLLIPVQWHHWSWIGWKIWPSSTSRAFSTHWSVDLHQGASKTARTTLMPFPQGWKLTDAVHYPIIVSRSLSLSDLNLQTLQEAEWTQEHQPGLPMMGTSHKTGRKNNPTPYLPNIYQKMRWIRGSVYHNTATWTQALMEALKWTYGIISASGNISC